MAAGDDDLLRGLFDEVRFQIRSNK